MFEYYSNVYQQCLGLAQRTCTSLQKLEFILGTGHCARFSGEKVLEMVGEWAWVLEESREKRENRESRDN